MNSDGAAAAQNHRWVARVRAEMAAGLAADSPAADGALAEIVGDGDGPDARAALLAGLEAAEPTEDAARAWLVTALRANPAPGARAAELEELYDEGLFDEGAAVWAGAGGVLAACERVLADVGRLVAAVRPDRFGDPTPCAGWDVRGLLDHLVWENLLWTSLAEGAPRMDHDADHLTPDHIRAFGTASAATLAAFRAPGLLTRRFGPAPGWRMVEQVVIEMTVHGWDLAVATGRPTDLAPDVAEAALPAVRAIYGALPRTPGGSFGREVVPSADATPADRLAAYLGRNTRAAGTGFREV